MFYRGKKKINIFGKSKIIYILLILIVICFVIWPAGFYFYYKDRVLPNVYLKTIPLGNKQIEELPEIVNKIFLEFSQDGFTFEAKGKEKTKTIVLPFPSTSSQVSLSQPFLFFDLSATLDLIAKAGRGENFCQNYKIAFTRFFGDKDILEPVFFLREEALEEELKNNFSELETDFKEASLTYQNNKIEIIPETKGYALNYEKAISQFRNNIENLENKPIKIEGKDIVPLINKEKVKPLIEPVSSLISTRPNFYLQIEENEWKLEPKDWLAWLEFYEEDGNVFLSLNKEKTLAFIEEINNQIGEEPLDARFTVENGRVVEFQPAKSGFKVDKEKAYSLINRDIFDPTKEVCQIDLEEILPSRHIEDVNDLGIKELVARGESNFAGSPPNRIHNIKVGAEKIHGLLIAPDEEFSLVKAIGPVSAETNFLPELVIKGNRTIPEYGGGLCQLGTTAFRLALNGGFPITERVPHSYRVSYYEPAGMDATIYQPHPDLRFINDTEAFLLLQTKVDGYNLIFELYGTSDGRKVIVSSPILENITPPGPPQYIETDELPPGEKRRIESAHNGATAHFTRRVIFENGIEREETWYSYYAPWPEVWLIGKELEEPATEEEKTDIEN